MNGQHRRRTRLIVGMVGFLATVGLVASFPAAADAYTLTGHHWGSSNIVIDIRSVTGNYLTAINQASANYKANTDANVTNQASSLPAFSAQNSNYGATGYEGNTTWSWNAVGTTISAHATLNSYYLGGAPVAQLKVVWLHELGHGLGLNHVTGTAYVMYSSASVAYGNGVRSLTFDEVAGINSLY